MRESEVAQSCPTLSDPMDRSLPGSSVHGIFQARVLEWGAIAFSVSHLRLTQFLNLTSLQIGLLEPSPYPHCLAPLLGMQLMLTKCLNVIK